MKKNGIISTILSKKCEECPQPIQVVGRFTYILPDDSKTSIIIV